MLKKFITTTLCLFLLFLTACVPEQDGKMELSGYISDPPKVSAVKIENQSLVITGVNLKSVDRIKLTNGSTTIELTPVSQTSSQIILKAIGSSFSFASNLIYGLVIDSAYGQSAYPIYVDSGSGANDLLTLDSNAELTISTKINLNRNELDTATQPGVLSLNSSNGSTPGEFQIYNDDGTFVIRDETNTLDRLWIDSAGDLFVNNDVSGDVAVCLSDGRNCPPAGGTGTVTSVSQGTGIVLSTNPIVTSGSVSIDTTVVATYGAASPKFTNAVTADGLNLEDGTNTYSVNLKANSTGTETYDLVFPAANGSNGDVLVLSDNTTGELAWSSSITPAAHNHSGAEITSGTIGAAYLPNASTSSAGILSAAQFTTFNNKQNAITTGTTAQYLRGDLSLSNFANDVAGSTLSGFVTGANTTVTNTDTVETAIEKLQGQINADGGGTVTSVTTTAPLSHTTGVNPTISISQATTTSAGYLSATDWNTFNNKANASHTHSGADLTNNTVTASKLDKTSIVGFRMTMGTSVNVAYNTTATLPFSNTTYDSGSDFDTANNRFVVPESGFYHFNCSVMPTTAMTSGSARFYVGLDMNQYYAPWPAYQTMTISSANYYTAGTVVECKFYNVANGSGNFSFTSSFSSFTGHRVH